MKAVKRDEREMRDCGVEWIAKIPSSWRVCKTLYGLSMPITDGPHTTPELYAEGVPFVSAEAISNGNGSIDFSHIRGYISEDFYQECSKKYIPQRDDIYMIKSGATTGKVSIVDTDRKFTIWSPLAVFRVNNERIVPKYLFYYIQSEAYQKQVELNWSYGTQQNIGMRVLEQLKICVPGLNEQNMIVSYLDDRCSKIDAIIAEAKASIEEYKELKQAVIYEAVTKGLDKNVEMRNSGVEWVGNLPSHWNYRKLRYSINDIGDIDHYMPESVTNGIPYIMTGDLKNRVSEIDFDKCKHVSRSDYEKLSVKIKAEKGDIIFARYATIGALCYVDIDADFLVSYSCVIIKPNSKSIDSHFLEYYLQSSSFVEEAKRYANSNVQANIGKESMFQVKIALPPLDEQKKIVDFLDLKITCLDNLINEKQTLIEDLEAYKKSLIYEVVTGKRKVVA